MQNLPQADRRTQSDRRDRPTSPLTSTSLLGSRSYLRRADDRKAASYVDRYGARSVLTTLLIILLSVVDATLTLRLVSLGAKEVNPVMDFFLGFGAVPFLAAKYVLTGICLVWFLIHKNFTIWGGRVKVKYILLSLLMMYGILIGYELLLLLIYY